jgi:hypothetical protein
MLGLRCSSPTIREGFAMCWGFGAVADHKGGLRKTSLYRCDNLDLNGLQSLKPFLTAALRRRWDSVIE